MKDILKIAFGRTSDAGGLGKMHVAVLLSQESFCWLILNMLNRSPPSLLVVVSGGIILASLLDVKVYHCQLSFRSLQLSMR